MKKALRILLPLMLVAAVIAGVAIFASADDTASEPRLETAVVQTYDFNGVDFDRYTGVRYLYGENLKIYDYTQVASGSKIEIALPQDANGGNYLDYTLTGYQTTEENSTGFLTVSWENENLSVQPYFGADIMMKTGMKTPLEVRLRPTVASGAGQYAFFKIMPNGDVVLPAATYGLEEDETVGNVTLDRFHTLELYLEETQSAGAFDGYNVILLSDGSLLSQRKAVDKNYTFAQDGRALMFFSASPTEQAGEGAGWAIDNIKAGNWVETTSVYAPIIETDEPVESTLVDADFEGLIPGYAHEAYPKDANPVPGSDGVTYSPSFTNGYNGDTVEDGNISLWNDFYGSTNGQANQFYAWASIAEEDGNTFLKYDIKANGVTAFDAKLHNRVNALLAEDAIRYEVSFDLRLPKEVFGQDTRLSVRLRETYDDYLFYIEEKIENGKAVGVVYLRQNTASASNDIVAKDIEIARIDADTWYTYTIVFTPILGDNGKLQYAYSIAVNGDVKTEAGLTNGMGAGESDDRRGRYQAGYFQRD